MTNEFKDIRWEQRFLNYSKVLAQLEKFVVKKDLNEMEEQGLIKSFEYTYELAWKTLQDLLKEKGFKDIIGPKPVIQQCFQLGYIEDGEGWVKMHNSRNLTSHTYDEESVGEIIKAIRNEFIVLFKSLRAKLEVERSGEQGGLFNDN